MALTVYDYHADLRNILTTPHIRARFMPLPVGQTARGHTHDLGHEVFLILQGRAEFDIDGEKAVLGPGQACIALVGQNHVVRNVGDEEVILYLSVTPHILPTHTFWDEEGRQEPPRFNPPAAYDAPDRSTIALEELAERHLRATEEMARTAAAALAAVRAETEQLKEALATGDRDGVIVARNQMWGALRAHYLHLFEQIDAWNDLAGRTAQE